MQLAMSTYHSIHYHIIFSTKHRKPWILDKWISDLHGYIGGTVKGLDAVPLKIGGLADHVNLLIGCKTKHCLADLVRELKKAATLWVTMWWAMRHLVGKTDTLSFRSARMPAPE